MSTSSRKSTIVRFAGFVKWRIGVLTRTVTGGALARERRVVRYGIKKYRAGLGGDRDLYLLRRNVHMIEKGLTMRPRRALFAMDYISETISAFERFVRRSQDGARSGELLWMQSVLTEYFDATSGADSAILSRLSARFNVLTNEIGSHRSSGPQPVRALRRTVDIESLDQLAIGRRSVRWYVDQPVDRRLVDRALEIGAESPTACNRQPYRFEVFDDPAAVRRVAAIPGGTRGFGTQIPGIIVIVGDMSAFFDERDRHLIYIDGSLAAMGVIYGLEAQGIANCCINWPDVPERDAAMRNLLGLAPHERVVMLIAYGYADPEGLAPASAKRHVEDVRVFRDL